MKRILSLVLAFVMLSGIFAAAYDTQSVFTADSDRFKGYEKYSFEDSFFAETSYNYNHNLAKMSMRVAMAAFFNRSSTERYRNILDLFYELKFNPYTMTQSYKDKASDTVGVFVAEQNCNGSPVVAVAVCGGNYGSQWGDNFNVGTGEYHEGFKTAADDALAFVADYINGMRAEKDVKVWITGYSRGAAVANLVAAELNRGAVAGVAPENVYAYCFATPGVTTNTNVNDELYNNIFNIINPDDVVSMIPPESWGFDRYGINCILPTHQNNSEYAELTTEFYKTYNSYVKKEYTAQSGITPETFKKYAVGMAIGNGFSFYLKPQNTDETAGDFFEKTLGQVLEVFGTREQYIAEYQTVMMEAGELFFGTPGFMLTFAEELMKNVSVTQIMSADGIKQIAGKAFDSTANKLQITVEENVKNSIIELVGMLVMKTDIITLIGNIEYLSIVHTPEIMLAWIDIMEEDDFAYNLRDDAILLTIDNKDAYVWGKLAVNDVAPVIRNDRTMLPCRFVAESLGAVVLWDDATKTVTVTGNGKEIKIATGSDNATVNGNTIKLDCPAFIENDRTYLPVRFITENLGAKVNWIAGIRQVVITK